MPAAATATVVVIDDSDGADDCWSAEIPSGVRLAVFDGPLPAQEFLEDVQADCVVINTAGHGLSLVRYVRYLQPDTRVLLSPRARGRSLLPRSTLHQPDVLLPEGDEYAAVRREVLQLFGQESGLLGTSEDGTTPWCWSSLCCVGASDHAAGLRESLTGIGADIGEPSNRSSKAWLLWGETGTGRRALAKELHEIMSHNDGPFVTLDCVGATREALFRELFGEDCYNQSSEDFFDGDARLTLPPEWHSGGLFAAARGGTLFINEVHEADDKVQRVLLAAQNSMTEPSGDQKPLLRLICSSRVDLPDLFPNSGETNRLELAPLRARRDDIALLSSAILAEIAPGRDLTLSTTALVRLMAYDWRGNVQELRNALEFAATLGAGEELTDKDLPGYVPAVPLMSGTSHESLADA